MMLDLTFYDFMEIRRERELYFALLFNIFIFIFNRTNLKHASKQKI